MARASHGTAAAMRARIAGPLWRRTNTGRTQAKTEGELNISLARTSISIR